MESEYVKNQEGFISASFMLKKTAITASAIGKQEPEQT